MNEDGARYERMTPDWLAQAAKRCPVAFVPAGICEWHGEQSACGLDGLKAESLCRIAARRLGGVCLPALWTGPGGSTPFDPARYPRGTLTVDRRVYERAAEQILGRLEAIGFRVAVWLSGHYPGVIPEIAAAFNRRGGMKVIAVSEDQVVGGLPAGDHAAAWETSLLMVLHPGLVDLARLPALPEGVSHAGDAVPPMWAFQPRCEYYGVYGADPRIWANVHFGRSGVEAIIDGLARAVGEALGDPSFGAGRGEIAWAGESSAPSTEYQLQLPYQWHERFEQAPVVYWPVLAAGEPVDVSMDHARSLAEQTGGMVFPPFAYGPGRDDAGLAVTPEVFIRIVAEVVHVLAGMGFRVIALLPGVELHERARADLRNHRRDAGATDQRGLHERAREEMRSIRVRDDQSRVVVVEGPGVSGELRSAIAETVPRDATDRVLDGAWTISGRREVLSLREAAFGPPARLRVYEHTFELSPDEAACAARLDLGMVENHCEVTLNDTSTLTRHEPPYRFLVTGRLRPGRNHLHVVVRHFAQPTLDAFYYRVGPPRLAGPVTLQLWRA